MQLLPAQGGRHHQRRRHPGGARAGPGRAHRAPQGRATDARHRGRRRRQPGGKDRELTSEIEAPGRRPAGRPAAAAKAADGGQYAAAGQVEGTADELSELARYQAADAEAKAKADMDAAVKAAVQEVMSSQTARSMAARIGDGPQAKAGIMGLAVKAHPFLAGVYGEGYVAGEAVTAVAQFTEAASGSTDVINAGKASSSRRAWSG
ncbi:MAG: hypothetical protein U0667_15275 [Chloroflexota bacterium]